MGKTTEKIPEKMISFRVEDEFKAAVDMEIARRQSTLRREGTLALAERLGIDPPQEEGQHP